MKLNVDQKRIVESNPNGHMLIRGVAGSGKTTVGVHKLPQLANYYCIEDEDRVLFVTYAKTLVNYIQFIYEGMEPEQASIFDMMNENREDRVQITTMDSIIYGLYKSIKRKAPQLANNPEIRTLFQKSIEQAKKKYPQEAILDLKNVDFIAEEVNWIKACGFDHIEIYSQVNRLGRTKSDSDGPQQLRKGSEKRAAIFHVMEIYNFQLEQLGKTDFKSMALEVRNALADGWPLNRFYTHLVIDEAQDLTKCQLDILNHLYKPKESSSVIFIADTAQSIYNHSWLSHNPFKSIGFDMSGRTRVLSKNYRTTVEIALAAYSLIEKDLEIVENENYVAPDVIERHGEKPVLKKLMTVEEEFAFIRERILELSSQFDLKDMCVTARNSSQLNLLQQYLIANGVEAEIVSNTKPDFSSQKVKLITMHSIKGLEFPVVFLMGMNDGVIPYASKGAESEELNKSMERRLVYVGMTRAKERLFISCSGKPSEFMNDYDLETLVTEEVKVFSRCYQVPVEAYRFKERLQDRFSDEEVVRQWVMAELVNKCNVPESMLDIEYQVSAFSKVGFVDVVAFEVINGKRVPYLFAEVKSVKIPLEAASSQLEQYVQTNRSVKYAVMTNGHSTKTFRVEKGLLVEGELPLYSTSNKCRMTYKDLAGSKLYEMTFSSGDYSGMTLRDLIHDETQAVESFYKMPLVGKVSAGLLKYAYEASETSFELPSHLLKIADEGYFMLEVDGDSMIEAGIEPGDRVVVRKQNFCNNMDIVIASLEDEATMKRYIRIGKQVALTPENANYEPIMVNESQVYVNGVVVGVLKG